MASAEEEKQPQPEQVPEVKKPKFTEADVDETIPHPYFELYRHTLLRGANSASLIVLLFAPPVLYLRGTRNPREIMYYTGRASLYGVVLGTALTALLTWARIRNDTRDMVFDRSYRLRYNKGQNHLDFVTYGVVGTGALAGALATPAVRGTGALYGSALGFGLSVFVHMMTKGKD